MFAELGYELAGAGLPVAVIGTGCDFSWMGAAAGTSRTEPVHLRRPVKTKTARVTVYAMRMIHVRKENASTASHSLQNLETMPEARLEAEQCQCY